jgi:GTP diphosphokinase / guanosine-3',5'-bis(diphosphate) 3'-diphosphatase
MSRAGRSDGAGPAPLALAAPAAAVVAPLPAPATRRQPLRRPVLRQYELVERVKAYDPQADEDLLNRAYVFAMKAHGSQLRASGDPYFHHPVEVAGILAEHKLDAASIATGLLHDTVEDTGATLADIETLFGREIARLVDGVTKLNQLELQSPQTAQAENFRKLLLAMSEDIRVLLVKLADRLHNMRTLGFIDEPERRQRIAAETMEIYVPLAQRIGMHKLRAEIADLAFAQLWPDVRESIVQRLAHLRSHDQPLVETIVGELHETLAKAGVETRISGREKEPISIWQKMKRKNVSFEQLSDIVAFRILVGSISACYAALGTIHGEYAMVPGRFKDFISTPKPNGYRSLHTTIIGPASRTIEVQIRTEEMHDVAEHGVAAHWAYKQHRNVTEGRQYRWIRELLDILEHASGPEEFLEHTKLEMFQDQVFCFTPRGDLIALPQGATPVDFAYAVHSEVGDTCIGAKVNGRIVQLRTRLNNGDQVEIITSKGSGPSPAWEYFVVTGKARARIRRFLRVKQRDAYIERGRELVQRALQKAGRARGDKALAPVVAQLRQKSVEDLLAAVGEGTVTVRQVAEALDPSQKPDRREQLDQKVVPLRRVRAVPPEELEDEPLDGLPAGTAYSLAGCCHPVPGDPIVGIVRTGKGVTVHQAACGQLARLDQEPERWLDLAWNTRGRRLRAAARLSVMVLNQPGSLGTVSTVIGRHGANITDVHIGRRAPDVYEMILDVEVDNLEQLHQIMAALRATAAVSSVERAGG